MFFSGPGGIGSSMGGAEQSMTGGTNLEVTPLAGGFLVLTDARTRFPLNPCQSRSFVKQGWKKKC